VKGMQIPFVNLSAQWESERDELLPIIDATLGGGHWVNGSQVEELEEALAGLCESRYAVALNSGTDALVFGLAALGIGRGDEVITPPNSFIASTAAICHLGAIPVFVDVLPDQTIDPEQVQEAVGPKTRAIMPVHLTGRMCLMNRLNEIAEKENLWMIEDAAQAIGSRYLGRASGSWGSFGCFSTHPLKNLNAIGDGGFIITQSKDWAEKIRRLRSHGLADRNTASEFGFVSRMDEVQAATLLYRLTRLSDLVVKRRRNADLYRSLLSDLPIVLPPEDADHWDTFHTFVIQTHDRDRLQDHLRKRGIGTGIHYPKLISDQPAMSTRTHRIVGTLQRAREQSQQILSLPINQTLDEKDIVLVAQEISNFYSGK